MSEAKRPWFQFHLSTAIVIMFEAASLLWLNMLPPFVTPLPDNDYRWHRMLDASVKLDYQVKFCGRGWPFHTTGILGAKRYESETIIYLSWPPSQYLKEVVPGFFGQSDMVSKVDYYDRFIAYNAFTCLGILAMTVLVSEFIIRRREGRKP